MFNALCLKSLQADATVTDCENNATKIVMIVPTIFYSSIDRIATQRDPKNEKKKPTRKSEMKREQLNKSPFTQIINF